MEDDTIVKKLVEEGKGYQDIAVALGVCVTTAKRRVKKLNLVTAGSYRSMHCLGCGAPLTGANRRMYCTEKCRKRHNAKKHYERYGGKICVSQSDKCLVLKARTLAAIGATGCSRCGYNKNLAALHFHHVNPAEKLFTISSRSLLHKPFEVICAEAKKCEVLCANCHAAEHNPQFESSCVLAAAEKLPVRLKKATSKTAIKKKKEAMAVFLSGNVDITHTGWELKASRMLDRSPAWVREFVRAELPAIYARTMADSTIKTTCSVCAKKEAQHEIPEWAKPENKNILTKKAPRKKYSKCAVCGKKIDIGRKYCSDVCNRIGSSKAKYSITNKQEIVDAFAELHSYRAVGKKYGVSDNAVKKWTQEFGIVEEVRKHVKHKIKKMTKI